MQETDAIALPKVPRGVTVAVGAWSVRVRPALSVGILAMGGLFVAAGGAIAVLGPWAAMHAWSTAVTSAGDLGALVLLGAGGIALLATGIYVIVDTLRSALPRVARGTPTAIHDGAGKVLAYESVDFVEVNREFPRYRRRFRVDVSWSSGGQIHTVRLLENAPYRVAVWVAEVIRERARVDLSPEPPEELLALLESSDASRT